MLSALLYLRLTSFKNWLLVRLRRLRQPKYLVGAIVGVAYFYFFFFRPLGDAATAPHAGLAPAHLPLPADWLPITTAVGALTLLFLATCLWVVPAERATLGFTEAEIAFLFPAPITRRGLIHFRLLSAQFRSFAGAAIMMLFSNRWTFLGGNALTHAIGWWFVFSALNLHLNGARFTLTRLADLGVGLWRRRLLVLALLAAIIAATLARVPPLASVLDATASDPRPFVNWIVELTQTAPLAWLLWPVELVLAPFVAPDVHSFLVALAPAFAILTLHYLWVVHAAVAFEDATIEHAQKRAAHLAAWQAGGPRISGLATKPRQPPFALGPTGRPELAFLWKNLLSTWPYFTWRVGLACAAVLALGLGWARTRPTLAALLPGLGVFVAAFAGYVAIVGPQFARQDLRRDLAHADLLKTYPLAGWQIVLGQLLTPAAILTGLLWLALLIVAFTLPPTGQSPAWFTTSVRVAALLGIALVTPPLVALQLLVPNAAALVFPGWFQSATRSRGSGPEVVGQRMLFFFAQLVAMLCALLPAALLAAAVVALTQWLVGPGIAIAFATTSVLLVLVVEVSLGVWLLGRRFEQLDLSAELRS